MAEVFLNTLWGASALLAMLSLVVMSLLIVHRFFRNRVDRRDLARRKQLRKLALFLMENPEAIIESRKEWTPDDRRLLLGLFEELRRQLKGEYAGRLISLMRIMGLMQECLERLRHPLWSRRAEAAETLGNFNDPNVILALYRALEDHRGEVRLAAGRSLARLRAVHSVRELVVALIDPRQEPSLAITEVFRSLEARHVEELRELIRDGRVPVNAKVQLIDAVGRLGDLGATEELIELYDHPSLRIRIATLQAMARLNDPRALMQILLAMTDTAWEVRAQAAICAGKLGASEAVPILQHLLTDSQWWVRYHAAEALAAIGGPGLCCLQATADEGHPDAANMAWGVLREKGLATI